MQCPNKDSYTRVCVCMYLFPLFFSLPPLTLSPSDFISLLCISRMSWFYVLFAVTSQLSLTLTLSLSLLSPLEDRYRLIAVEYQTVEHSPSPAVPN